MKVTIHLMRLSNLRSSCCAIDHTRPVATYNLVMMVAGSGRVRSIGGLTFSPI